MAVSSVRTRRAVVRVTESPRMQAGSSLMHLSAASMAAKRVAYTAAEVAASMAGEVAASMAAEVAEVTADAKVCQFTECRFGEDHDAQSECPISFTVAG